MWSHVLFEHEALWRLFSCYRSCWWRCRRLFVFAFLGWLRFVLLLLLLFRRMTNILIYVIILRRKGGGGGGGGEINMPDVARKRTTMKNWVNSNNNNNNNNKTIFCRWVFVCFGGDFFFFFFFFGLFVCFVFFDLQHVRSSGPGAIVCKSRATHRALITCNMCYVPRGTKEQLGDRLYIAFSFFLSFFFALSYWLKH